ncbi:hypothetical protein A1O3_08879 [Capronia epimyces CBS 606.96]|uniref:Transcription factor domain-containing protein n=1 Tax=Capronia epimyces CBS 606.96 TaxID=1182542 RepID=W9XFX0_9EURO|nr:uncharacterized protein A1O3_08879 [Capronia epimyces CBS 606.96]EXJ79377.1 hypothetical protein A1O3_08879 [Capronia epimyces CBS 606.96]
MMALRVRRKSHSLWSAEQDTTTPLQRTSAESLLYQAAVTALLSSNIEWLSGQTVWQQVEMYLSQIWDPAKSAGPKKAAPAPAPGVSLLLGIDPALCRLVREISCLARRTPLQPADQSYAMAVRTELDLMIVKSTGDAQSGKRSPPSTAGRSEDEKHFWDATKFYVCAADVLLRKTMHPHLTAEHAHIQALVQQMLDILKQSNIQGHFWSQHYCWPFTILACALLKEDDMVYLDLRLEEIWENSHWGDVKRTLLVLRRISKERYRGGTFRSHLTISNIGGPVAAFDLLLLKDGLSFLIES